MSDDNTDLENRLATLGEIARPIVEALPGKITGLTSAMLCTPEGFNICAMGFEAAQVAKMAAVSSSLYAMAKSILTAFSGKRDRKTHVITIQGEGMDIIGKRIDIPDQDPLILIIACKDTRPGLLLYAAQFVEESLQKSFAS